MNGWLVGWFVYEDFDGIALLISIYHAGLILSTYTYTAGLFFHTLKKKLMGLGGESKREERSGGRGRGLMVLVVVS